MSTSRKARAILPRSADHQWLQQLLQELMEPLVISWGWRPTDPGPSKFVDEHERQGTRDPAAYLSVPAAISYQQSKDWDTVRAECHELARYARAGLLELTQQQPLAPDDACWFAQMVT